MESWGALWTLGFAAFNLAVIVCDALSRRVPNVLLVLGLLVQLVWLAVAPWRPVGVTFASAGLGFVLGLCFVICWRLRVMGAADVKYLAVLGALMGWKGLFYSWLLGTLIVFVHALVLALLRMFVGWSPRRGAPYAAYVAVGALMVAHTRWNLL